MNRNNKIFMLIAVMSVCLWFSGCGSPHDGKQNNNTDVAELTIQNLRDYCVDEGGKNIYFITTENNTVYSYGLDGTKNGEYSISADDAYPMQFAVYGEEDSRSLSNLCLAGGKLYVYRENKGTLTELDMATGEQNVLAVRKDAMYVQKMAAGENTVMLLGYRGGETAASLIDKMSGEELTVPVENPAAVAVAEKDSYWINTCENGQYCFRLYDAGTGEISEAYDSNFTYGMSDISYDKSEGSLYGYLVMGQYVKFSPKDPKVAARYTAVNVEDIPGHLQYEAGRIFIKSSQEETVFSFYPDAFIKNNKPLKAYTTSEMALSDWGGYQIELEVLDWEELALKMLAGDSDYDFVITSTDMAQAETIRNAMMYTPIPEEMISDYWNNCYPCIREGAVYQGDIWMLPLKLRVKGIVYQEDNLGEYGVNMQNVHTAEDLCEAGKVLYENVQDGRYEISFLNTFLLQDYVRRQRMEEEQSGKEISFDTEEFRQILAFVKQEYRDGGDYLHSEFMNHSWDYAVLGNESPEEARRRKAQTVCLETVEGDAWDYAKYEGTTGVHVCGIPGIAGEATSQITADVLIINPNAPHKKEALQYAAQMAEAYCAQPENFLTANRELYPEDGFYDDLHQLYMTGTICFSLPEGLFDRYYRYGMSGDVSEEEVIEELERKVKMYMGE